MDFSPSLNVDMMSNSHQAQKNFIAGSDSCTEWISIPRDQFRLYRWGCDELMSDSSVEESGYMRMSANWSTSLANDNAIIAPKTGIDEENVELLKRKNRVLERQETENNSGKGLGAKARKIEKANSIDEADAHKLRPSWMMLCERARLLG